MPGPEMLLGLRITRGAWDCLGTVAAAAVAAAASAAAAAAEAAAEAAAVTLLPRS